MSNSAAYVLLGKLWVNYGTNVPPGLGPRITVPEYTSYILSSALAVWVTVWNPGYWALIKALLRRCSPRNIYTLVEDTHTADDGALKTSRSLLIATWKREDLSLSQVIVFIGTFGIFIAISIGATYVANLVLDSSVVSTLPNCTIWFLDPTVSDNARDPAVILPGDVIEDVEFLYESCYESEPSQQSCLLFTESDLRNSVTVNASCPFANISMCSQGTDSAIEFNTVIDVNEYGVNVDPRRSPWIERSTTCAPVAVEGYFTQELDRTNNYTTIKFYYGPDDTPTHNQTRSLFLEATFSPTGIELKVISERLAEFLPMPGLKSPDGIERVALAFINIYNVEYPQMSNDSIFNATTSVNCTNDASKTCYIDTILPASVLGCTESALICPPGSHTVDKCLDVFSYTNITYLLPDVQKWSERTNTDLGASILLAQALFWSDLANTVSTRHGFLLDATRRIDGSKISRPLSTDPPQWQLEMRRLFEIGLLRTKMEMLAVVTGKRAGWYGYVDVLKALEMGAGDMNLCMKYRFVGIGVQNITFVGFLVAILAPVLVGAWAFWRPVRRWILCSAWLVLKKVGGLLVDVCGILGLIVRHLCCWKSKRRVVGVV